MIESGSDFIKIIHSLIQKLNSGLKNNILEFCKKKLMIKKYRKDIISFIDKADIISISDILNLASLIESLRLFKGLNNNSIIDRSSGVALMVETNTYNLIYTSLFLKVIVYENNRQKLEFTLVTKTDIDDNPYLDLKLLIFHSDTKINGIDTDKSNIFRISEITEISEFNSIEGKSYTDNSVLNSSFSIIKNAISIYMNTLFANIERKYLK